MCVATYVRRVAGIASYVEEERIWSTWSLYEGSYS